MKHSTVLQVLHRFIDFCWEASLPPSVQELPLKPVLGSPNFGLTVLFPECLSSCGEGGLHSGSSGTRLFWKSLRMWFSITCCTFRYPRATARSIGV